MKRLIVLLAIVVTGLPVAAFVGTSEAHSYAPVYPCSSSLSGWERDVFAYRVDSNMVAMWRQRCSYDHTHIFGDSGCWWVRCEIYGWHWVMTWYRYG